VTSTEPRTDIFEHRPDEPVSEELLLAAARDGSTGAFGILYARHREHAVTVARRTLPSADAALAEDVAEAAFIDVFTALRNGKGPADTLRFYLVTAVRRQAWRMQRRQRRHSETVDRWSAEQVATRPLADDAEVGGATLGGHLVLTEAFSSLSERWRHVLWLTEVEGRKPAEIAPMLGLSAGSASALAYRARQGLVTAYLAACAPHRSGPGCEALTSRLASYLSVGRATDGFADVEAHLEGCRACRDLARGVDLAGSTLGAMAPFGLLTLGWWAKGAGATAGAGAALGGSAVGGSALLAGAGSRLARLVSGGGSGAGVAAAAAVVVLVVAAAAVGLSGGGRDDREAAADAPAAVAAEGPASTAAVVESSSVTAASTPAPSAAPSTPPATLPPVGPTTSAPVAPPPSLLPLDPVPPVVPPTTSPAPSTSVPTSLPTSTTLATTTTTVATTLATTTTTATTLVTTTAAPTSSTSTSEATTSTTAPVVDPPGTGVLSGRVLVVDPAAPDADQGVEGVRIVLQRPFGEGTELATGPDGRWVVPRLARGRYVVLAEVPAAYAPATGLDPWLGGPTWTAVLGIVDVDDGPIDLVDLVLVRR
jgi:RNA polymerase sigma factor (sigma-70 family)